ncbi:hypothetical protein Sste5346_004880 [Sporothrix stenoceras]|uniref:Major facilitator superfamily (MFS) profile domain-containing protein n=1 Tax=Sporothrix stenoceras TaxID=5173 RepID=A0ABR3Z675_9PEZI
MDDIKTAPVASEPAEMGDTEKVQSLAVYDDVGRALYEQAQTYDVAQLEQDAHKVKRKLDFIVLPMMMITYALGFLDKSTLNYANVYGLQKDLHMTGGQYDWVASAASLGWLISAYPASLILQKFSISRLMGGLLIVWGGLCMLTAATTNYGGIFTLRLLLGGSEAPITPGTLMLTSMMWTSQEAPLRTSMWLAVDGVATIVGALLAWGLGHTASDVIPSWKFVFLVVGAITVAWAGVILVFLPDGPHKGRIFSEYERAVLVWRVAKDKRGVKSPKLRMYQIWETLIDPKTWLLCLSSAALGILNGGVVNFKSALISGFGFAGQEANLLGMPSGAIQIAGCVLFGMLAGLKNMKGVAIILSCIPGMVGLIGILTISHDPKYKYSLVACTWLQSCIASPIALSWSLPVVNVAGHTKRSCTLGLIFIFFSAGMIGGPHLFIAKEALRYPTAIIGLLSSYGAAMVLQAMYTALCYFQNKARDEKYGRPADGGDRATDDGALRGFEDQTDMENKDFRFSL